MACPLGNSQSLESQSGLYSAIRNRLTTQSKPDLRYMASDTEKISSGNKSEHSSKTIQAMKLSFGYLIELYISTEQEEFELLK